MGIEPAAFGTTASLLINRSSNSIDRSSDIRTAEKDLQSVFSAVLAQTDQQGYVSARPLDKDASLQDSIGKTWDAWFGKVAPTGYSQPSGPESPSVREGKTVADLQADYRAILLRAFNEGGYASPTTFLQKLSKDELAAVQQVQHLAKPIRVEGLSQESSLNLLLPPATQVDLNNDGITSVGAASKLKFPDSRTPSIVRDAWEAATAEMSFSDRMIYELKLTRVNLSREEGAANLPDSATVASFISKAESWLEYLDHFKSQIPPDQHRQDEKFWTNFRNNILNSGAAHESLNN